MKITQIIRRKLQENHEKWTFSGYSNVKSIIFRPQGKTVEGYSEGQVWFDQYIENSLKANTRKGREDIDSNASYQIQ